MLFFYNRLRLGEAVGRLFLNNRLRLGKAVGLLFFYNRLRLGEAVGRLFLYNRLSLGRGEAQCRLFFDCRSLHADTIRACLSLGYAVVFYGRGIAHGCVYGEAG